MGPLFNSVACERLSVSGHSSLPYSVAILLIYSSTWFFSTHRHSALKVVKSAGRYAETARDEIKLLSRVSSFSPSHPGRQHIVSFLDSFSHQGPEAQHVCIVFEPLGENLLALIERNKKKGVPRSLVKVITRQILLGLEYLHDECDLVHTDIKPENICEFLLFPLFFLSHRCPVHMVDVQPHLAYRYLLHCSLSPFSDIHPGHWNAYS